MTDVDGRRKKKGHAKKRDLLIYGEVVITSA